MTGRFVIAASVGVACVAGTAMLAAPGQGTRTPGQVTEGKVWIENRGRNEAIPIVAPDPLVVNVQNVAGSSVAVRLAGATPGTPPPPVAVQRAQQNWEYRTMTIPADSNAQEVTTLLTAPGNLGFELAGVQLSTASGTLVVLKRPRP